MGRIYNVGCDPIAGFVPRFKLIESKPCNGAF